MNVTLIIILLCIIMSGYFSATETAFSSLNRIRIKNMADKGNKRAALVLKLSEDYDRLLSTILIGNNIVNIACASLSTLLFVRLLGEDAGASVSTAVTTVIVLVFGEVSPKSIAKESPEKFSMFSAPILNFMAVLLTPLNFLFKQWKKVLSRFFHSSASQGITEEELITIVEEARQDGGIDEQEGDLLRNALEFNELKAADILTPRIDVVGVNVCAGAEEIASVFTETGYSRLPVYQDSIDNIVGILYHKDFYNKIYGTGKGIKDVIRPALFITRHKKISQLLQELQASNHHIAVVIDEFGGTVGIVTLEDILEELVGEIWDEHDEIIRSVEKLSDDEFLVLGNANVDKLLELLGYDEETEAVTVNGWIMNELQKLPEKGDSFRFHEWQVTVMEMEERRVKSARICRCGQC
ncbi:HlyC/CorC family transporter [Eisenbergiella tayi]|uniref:Transporter n=2 Tax=Eisenbergiella tayi TaxID=1432052 RepID=A0A1E3UI13_9FIRM|nr:hemolysin family protein [Eisenbergiella tayi]ODR49709.1 transporter [Eisenbergiella tayi]ODR50460.1 transporter [Eisenbergiella tayi]ODR60423.1 transporter [Eisenbergiella tayi]CUQ62778.1 Putative Mg2+ and Co2+ transporter CorB [Fusicatenibacter sp. 2789STDY5834925]